MACEVTKEEIFKVTPRASGFPWYGLITQLKLPRCCRMPVLKREELGTISSVCAKSI